MASPLAHGLAGAVVYAALTPRSATAWDWRPWALAAFAGAAADLDFLPGLVVGHPNRYHHWATHSLLAAVAFALVVGAVASPALGSLRRRASVLGLAYLSHLGLDVLTAHVRVQGIPLFWPLSDRVFIAPVAIFRHVRHGHGWAAFVNWHNVGAVLLEALLVGIPVALVLAWRAMRETRDATAPAFPGGRQARSVRRHGRDSVPAANRSERPRLRPGGPSEGGHAPLRSV